MRGALVVVALLLVALVGVAYEPAVRGDFVSYDDDKYVTANPVVARGLTGEGIAWAFTRIHDANWIPLVWVSLMADAELFGLDARGFHATNVVLHALSSVLLLLALRRMTGDLARSAFVAGVFALHPLHAQSVAWISERKDVLSGLFWMATLLAWARYRERPGPGRYAAVFASLCLGLLCKATAVTLPFVLLLLDHWPGERFRDATDRRAELRRAVLEKLPLLVPVALACAVTLLAQSEGGIRDRIDWPVRAGHAFVAWGFYLQKALWPSGLQFFYPHPELPPSHPRVLACAALVVGATAALALAARRGRAADPALVGWLWYLGTLVPMIGLVQVGAQGMADRYSYVPLIGLAIGAAWLPGLAGARARVAGALAAVALVAWIGGTRAEARRWGDSEALFTHAIEVDPDNYMAHYELARFYNADGQPGPAERHAAQAVRLVPSWSDALLNLGAALGAQGRHAEAEKAYRRALARRPDDLAAGHRLARSLLAQGRLEPAEAQLIRMLRRQPGDIEARLLLGEVHARSGDRLAALLEWAAVCKLVGPEGDGVEAGRRILALMEGWPDAPSEARALAREAVPAVAASVEGAP